MIYFIFLLLIIHNYTILCLRKEKLIENILYGHSITDFSQLPLKNNKQTIPLLKNMIDFQQDILKSILSCKIYSTNYQSIIQHFINETKMYYTILHKVEERTRVKFEIDKCSGVLQKDVNNYVFEREDGGVTPRGAYVAQRYNDEHGLFQCRRNLDILDVGIVDYLLYNKDPHETIYGTDWLLWKFQMVKKIGGMYKACAYEVDGKIIPTPNRCNRVFAAKNKEKYGKVKKMKNGKETWDNVESLPEHCWINNNDIRGVHVSDVLDNLDLEWYENEIKRKICDFTLETSERTKGKNYSLEEDWKRVQVKLGREI